jgi:cellulose synthase/poly-beta-1,6-N-acetylglucosamine synthase-like glycosyltransferase
VFKDSRRIPLGSSDSLNGFHYKGNAYEPHNHINFLETAVQRFSIRQTLILLSLLFIVVLGFIADWHRSLVSIISFLTVVYFLDLMLNLLLVSRSYFSFKPELVSHAEMKAINDWPSYTVLCPLYKETAVLPQFVNAMSAINYPHDKLEILLLLEQDDINTIATAKRMKLPAYFKIVIVPDSMPKTKPKACNYGLKIATGEYIVIYDAEDIPATNQLKKAVITFNRSTEKVGCVQAKLNYYNWNQNVLTRLFTMEYSLWFELILPGLQSIHAPIPLGGTSNHFRTANLRKLGGWDPFNVTEDADLGIRLSKNGFSTLVLDSITMEEANSQYKNWVRQRSRWIKGYIQTYFVHTRKLEKKQSTRNLIIFQFIIGGKVLSSLINPLLWGLTVFYFIFPGEIGHFIHSLYSPAIFYLALITLVVGNFLYMYYYMMGVVKRNHSELVMVAPLVPFYWLLISVATFKAIYEFIVKPFYWQKTQHGLHLVGLNHIRDDQQPILELEIDSSGNVG